MQPGKLFHDLNALLRTEQPAQLGPERRAGVFPISVLDKRLREAFQETDLSTGQKDLFRSIFYLWHDHLHESHDLSQRIETQDGSLVHGMMHRREPDYANAKYWFRRVGVHPSFHALAVKARGLLEKHGETDLQSRLVPNNSWDPFAFIDAVEDAQEGTFRSKIGILEQLQLFEFECLLENLVNRL